MALAGGIIQLAVGVIQLAAWRHPEKDTEGENQTIDHHLPISATVQDLGRRYGLSTASFASSICSIARAIK